MTPSLYVCSKCNKYFTDPKQFLRHSLACFGTRKDVAMKFELFSQDEDGTYSPVLGPSDYVLVFPPKSEQRCGNCRFWLSYPHNPKTLPKAECQVRQEVGSRFNKFTDNGFQCKAWQPKSVESKPDPKGTCETCRNWRRETRTLGVCACADTLTVTQPTHTCSEWEQPWEQPWGRPKYRDDGEVKI